MTFANIHSITLPSGVSLQASPHFASSHAARTAQMVGSMSWVAEHASRWWRVTPVDLCSAAITIALLGPADLDQVMTVSRRWPRERAAGELRCKPSFSEPAYSYIEDLAASFSIAVNGGGSTPDEVARNFALGVAKSALWAIVVPGHEVSAGFNSVRPGFNNTPLPPQLIEQLLPQAEARAIFRSVDATRAPLEIPAAVTVSGDADVTPTPNSQAASAVAETVVISELVDAMQRSPFRVKQKPQLAVSTIRIWLHTLGLVGADTVAELRTALATWPAGIDFQQAVHSRSLRYGLSLRAPQEFKALDTTPERCDAIIIDNPGRFAVMSPAQELERSRRWSHWVRYLRSENFAGGQLPHFKWRHPD